MTFIWDRRADNSTMWRAIKTPRGRDAAPPSAPLTTTEA
jgi:hypothetical protein